MRGKGGATRLASNPGMKGGGEYELKGREITTTTGLWKRSIISGNIRQGGSAELNG